MRNKSNARSGGCDSERTTATRWMAMVLIAWAVMLAACQRRAEESVPERNTAELSEQRCREAFTQLSQSANEIVVQLPGSRPAPRTTPPDQPFMQRCTAIAPEAQRCLVPSYAAANANCSQHSREMATVTRK